MQSSPMLVKKPLFLRPFPHGFMKPKWCYALITACTQYFKQTYSCHPTFGKHQSYSRKQSSKRSWGAQTLAPRNHCHETQARPPLTLIKSYTLPVWLECYLPESNKTKPVYTILKELQEQDSTIQVPAFIDTNEQDPTKHQKQLCFA